MKMKKLLISVFMLAVMFSLAGCDEKVEAPFEYDEAQIVIDTMYLFDTYNAVDEEYTNYYISAGNAFEQSAVKGIVQAQETDKVGEYQDFSQIYGYTSIANFDINTVGAEFDVTDEYVMVKVINKAQNRDVEVSVKYVGNSEYYIEYDKLLKTISMDDLQANLEATASQNGITVNDLLTLQGYSSVDDFVSVTIEQSLSGQGIYPYVPEEMVVSAVYSKKELMGQAGMNTLIGMGTVFVVLIFISFIISLFKYLPALFAKKPKVEKVEETKTAPVATVAKSENLTDDAELVAVITAAIYAYESASGNSGISKDKLVVRSIKRVKR